MNDEDWPILLLKIAKDVAKGMAHLHGMIPPSKATYYTHYTLYTLHSTLSTLSTLHTTHTIDYILYIHDTHHTLVRFQHTL